MNSTSNLSICPSESSSIGEKVLVQILVPIFFSAVVLVGFFGNLLVVIVIVANNHMRNTANILILSLALADLLFIIFCVPMTALYYFFEDWIFGNIPCVLFQYFTYTSFYLSVYTLVLMSLDRYLAVVHPITSIQLRNQRNTIVAVITAWLLICLGHLFYVWNITVKTATSIQNTTTTDGQISNCITINMACVNDKFYSANTSGVFNTHGRVFYTSFNVFGFVFPVMIIITLYALLVIKLLFGRSAHVSQSENAASSKKRVTKMVVIIIIIFCSCWLPIHIVFAIQVWIGDVSGLFFRFIHIISQILAYTNSCMNPILYAFLSDNFRQAFAKFLGITLKPRSRSKPITKNTTANVKNGNELHVDVKKTLLESNMATSWEDEDKSNVQNDSKCSKEEEAL